MKPITLKPETAFGLAAVLLIAADLLVVDGTLVEVSNLRTGVVPSIKEHPIREYFDQGLLVTVSSDDPSLFHTDMNNEYIQLHQQLSFTIPELFQISMNGVDAAFLDEGKKNQLRSSFLSEYRRIIE